MVGMLIIVVGFNSQINYLVDLKVIHLSFLYVHNPQTTTIIILWRYSHFRWSLYWRKISISTYDDTDTSDIPEFKCKGRMREMVY